ncbi:GNAT family N-acetyltransferase [Streptomyces sp. KL116D]|uniref:GNAT family N-acetyltransferase n=1 Tax=Streptomyces sp. KL116D TaxID=3045152 RepID=UPI003556B876
MTTTPRWNGDRVAFRQATPAQTDDVLEVLDEAAGWLADRRIAQWPARFEAAWIEEALARGETWLAHTDDGIAGTVTLDRADPLWADTPGDAVYVHRMAVRRRAAGLGAVVLDWVQDTAGRDGTPTVRLDCVRANDRLRAYYASHGFAHRGDVPVTGAPGQRGAGGPVTWVSRYERTRPPA